MSTGQELAPIEAAVEHVRDPQMRQQIEALSGGKFSVERFVEVTVTAMRQSPDIVTVAGTAKGKNSIFRAVARCAQDGLLPNGKEAALVKFGDEVVYMPMVDGLKKVAAEHGWTLRARVVYANDEFFYSEEPPAIRHMPVRPGADRGEIIASYATARHHDGRYLQCVLHPQDIAKRRAIARSKKTWDEWPAQMAEKSAARDLFQDIPLADGDRERVNRILAADSTPADSAALLYGQRGEQGESFEISRSSAARELERADDPAPVPQPAAGEAGPAADAPPPRAVADPASTPDPEPSIFQPPDDLRDDVASVKAQAAAMFHPPSQKYGHLSLAEIHASGKDGEGWFLWALRTVDRPPAYVQALRDYARVYLPAIYTRALAEAETA